MNILINLSRLIAHKLKIDAVHSRISKEIQISHKIHPTFHVSVRKREIKSIMNSETLVKIYQFESNLWTNDNIFY